MATRMDTQSDQHTIEIEDRPICHNRLADVRLARIILDPATGRLVRMFECDDCGQRTWDD
jgi:hypothetical protein